MSYVPIADLPTPPSRRDRPDTFRVDMDATLGQLPDWTTQANDLGSFINTAAAQVAADAALASGSAVAASAAANASRWVSGTTYAQDAVVISPITYLSYRRKTAGGGTTDPSSDTTNWAALVSGGDVTLTGTQTLTNKTITAMASSSTVRDAGGTAWPVGFRNIPSNAQTSAYVLALADVGKCVDITTGGVTVPANATVAFAIGDTVSIYNNSASSQTITAASGVTLRLAGTAQTGSRTLAAYGWVSVRKIASDTWVISGAGLT